jgi:hypothetical protein
MVIQEADYGDLEKAIHQTCSSKKIEGVNGKCWILCSTRCSLDICHSFSVLAPFLSAFLYFPYLIVYFSCCVEFNPRLLCCVGW